MALVELEGMLNPSQDDSHCPRSFGPDVALFIARVRPPGCEWQTQRRMCFQLAAGDDVQLFRVWRTGAACVSEAVPH